MNTIEKRTFNDGSTLELFQRKDGTYRLKFICPNGDELSTSCGDGDFYKNKFIRVMERGKEIESSLPYPQYGTSYAQAMFDECNVTISMAANNFVTDTEDFSQIPS